MAKCNNLDALDQILKSHQAKVVFKPNGQIMYRFDEHDLVISVYSTTKTYQFQGNGHNGEFAHMLMGIISNI